MRRKQKQTLAEKTAEEFFPVKERDLRYAVKKEYNPVDRASLTTVEKQGEVKKKVVRKRKNQAGNATKRKRTTKSKKSQKKTVQDYKPAKVKLDPSGYELIITEKPQAALKIASALGNSKKRDVNGVPYYEVERQGKKIVVACAVGHLFTLAQTTPRASLPVFDIKWVPNYIVRKGDFSKRYYDTLVRLMKNAGSLTVATDYDIEGEVIGLNVVRFIGNQKDSSRMKFSTLTDKELNDSYEKKAATIDWGQAIAGETRHYLDWFYGINLSRELMNALKSVGKFKIMSIGRVQGPALNLIVEKESKILAFKSQPYWQVFITISDPRMSLLHNKDIFKKSELEKFKDLKGKTAKVSTQKKTQEIPPNPPFNLTTLQTEAYRLFGFNPARTLQIAQSLYLSGLISYPRTSSQKLPPSINYQDILKRLASRFKAENLITRKAPIEGKKTDPAHPSIYPTGQGDSGALREEERKLWELIAKRFLSLFCEDAVLENKTVTAVVDGLLFTKKGSSLKRPGWMQIYPVKMTEAEVPDVEGEKKIIGLDSVEKETQPPRRFSPASLVSELEKKNLGTKATRANIIETLYDRGYIAGQSIAATPLGISLIDTLKKHSPIIIDEALTRKFEKEMDSIQAAKKGQLEKEQKVIEEAKGAINKITAQFLSQETAIGEELAGANTKLREQQREENKLNQCPVCKKGNLTIMYSKKNGRYFVACDRYPECKNTYSLPPNSLIKRSDKTCEHCGWPMLLSIRKGKRPWLFCFNPQCETNKERIEEYRRRKEREERENAGQ